MAEIDEQVHRARFGGQRARATSSERAAIIDDALAFAEHAKDAEGPELRRLIEPWIGYLRFDKEARTLSIGIRSVPDFVVLSEPSSARGEHKHNLIERTVDLRRWRSA